ncbi:YbgC/FadM family acyl-CoA thioesterase [Sphingomonas sp.]|uniref:YbgC/FadM family acyl-CoA thioesterase n=1 Tax=Sphingomonas sp. TaxID=28214 RepID=UPI003B3B80DF
MTYDATDQPYTGRFFDGGHRFALRVYYEDTDAGGYVYHANFLRFFERARTDMLALAGADIAAMQKAGQGGYVVSKAELNFVRPAHLGDTLVILSWLVDIRAAACTIQQRVMRNDQSLVEGLVTVAFVGPDGRPKRQPTAWLNAFRLFKGADQPQ